MLGIERVHVVAELAEEVQKFEMVKLLDALTEQFGSEGLEFSAQIPSLNPPGVYARFEDGL